MIEVVKGGLILDLGVRGFLPASLVDIRRVQDLDEFLSKELRCKVIELNRSRNNVVLSRRAVLEDERKEMRQAILDRLNPGDVVERQISNIVDFGAFVDLDGMDGLIHISELSWGHVNHPSEVLEIGQTVKVKVLDIDRERQRISLGLKQTQSDPVAAGARQLRRGRRRRRPRHEGRDLRRLRRDPPGVEGLVHISELAQHHVENPREVVSQGDAVNVLILEIDGERRRLSLSLKRVEEGMKPLPRADGGVPCTRRPTWSCPRIASRPGAAVETGETQARWSRRSTRSGEVEAEVEAAGRGRGAAEAEARPRLRPRPRPEAAAAAEPEPDRAETPAAEADTARRRTSPPSNA